MGKILTYDEMMREAHTETTAPMTMELFTGMLDGKPLAFMDHGTLYQVPAGEDVKMIFEGLVDLVNANVETESKDMTNQQKLALHFAQMIGKQKDATQSEKDPDDDKEVVDDGDGNQ